MKIAKNICAVIGVIGFLTMFCFAGEPAPDSTITLAQQVGGMVVGTIVMLAGYFGFRVCNRICEVRRHK